MTIIAFFPTAWVFHTAVRRSVILAGVLILLGAGQTRAATLTWTGLGGGNWGESVDWSPAGIPADGDTLIFPAGSPHLSNTNNLPGRVLAGVRFTGAGGGYAIFGNPFAVTNSIQATNTGGQNIIANDLNFPSSNVVITVGDNATLYLGGALGGTAALVKSGAGTLAYVGGSPNTYTNVTTVNQGVLVLNKTGLGDLSLHGPLVIGNDLGGFNSDIVQLGAFEQMDDNIPVTILSSGLLDLAGTSEFFGSLAGTGNLVLGTASPQIGFNNLSTTFSGVISGSGTLHKRGNGILTLTGNNTYPATAIEGGTLIFNGFQTNRVSVSSGATLGGSGAVGIVTAASGATVSPGSSPGILSCSNLVLQAGSILKIEINGGIPGLGFDQLSIQGTNTISGALLNLSTLSGATPLEGQPLVILDNDQAESITGTFSALPEGSLVTVGLLKFRISYVGGDGNDLTLTLTNPPAKAIGSLVSGGNGNASVDVNECNDLRLILTNTSGVALTGVNARLTSVTPGADIIQNSSTYPNVPASGTATNLVAFRIITQPTFICGTPIDLILALTTDGGGFAVPFRLSSATASSPVRFDYNTPTNILDLTTNDLPLVVAGITNPLAKVTVSLFATHTFDGDLSFFLLAPNGTSVELSSGNGSLGDNYGTNCADAWRTTFDDAATSPITNGVPPYMNSYRPESPLAVLAGLSGTNVNGIWNLRVIDGSINDQGTLNCWSLFLTPLNCPSGGGVCSICANTVISGAIGEGSAIQGDRLSRSGQPSSCAAPTSCLGGAGYGATFYEEFKFQNGATNACINVSLAAPTADLFSAAYLGLHDTTNLCLNYLADSGDSTATFIPNPATYSFVVPANATFVVTVNNIEGSTGPYQLTVTGGDCRPVLTVNRTPVNQVKLEWPSSADGYLLEANPSLFPTNWVAVTNVPALNGGRYAVTNAIGTNRFYRLRKPL